MVEAAISRRGELLFDVLGKGAALTDSSKVLIHKALHI